MRRLLIPMLLPVVMLWQSCGSTQFMEKANRIGDDIAVVAGRLKSVSDAVPALGAKVDAAEKALTAKVDAAMNKARAAGLNVDGTEADFATSIAQNPIKSWSAGIGTLAMAAFGVWQRNRAKRAAEEKAAREKAEREAKEDALKAVVDTVGELTPEAAKEFKSKVAAHPRMHSGSRMAVAAAETR